jgi:hypothetical protein
MAVGGKLAIVLSFWLKKDDDDLRTWLITGEAQLYYAYNTANGCSGLIGNSLQAGLFILTPG